MILASIELVNFRSYYGTHSIQLVQPGAGADKNIVAIGGLNGTGKTSFLEAIVFGLLGVADAYKFIEDVERRGGGRDQIDRTLDGLLNRHARDAGEREVRVMLVFRENDGQHFSVQRVWTYDYRGQYKAEQLLVATSSAELSEDQFEDFLKNRIPPEVAKFFFFDGEKIQAIAQDEIGDAVISGIDSLLGFHLLDALVSDIDKLQDDYRAQAKKRNRQEEELSELRSQETKLSNKIRELEDEQVELEERVDTLRGESRRLVEDLNQFLGGQGASPKDLQTQLDKSNDRIRTLKDGILDDVDRWIIPAMPTELLQQLFRQLEGEEERAQWEEGKRKVEPQRKRLIDRVLGADAPRPVPTLIPDQIEFLKTRIHHEWDDLFNPPPAGIAETVIHGYLSSEERGQVRSKCAQVTRSNAGDLRSLLNQLDSAERKARDLRQHLERIGDGEQVTAIIDQKAKVDRELGEADTAWGSHKRHAQSLSTDLKDVHQKIKKKENELLESGESGQRADFVRKVKRAIQQYQTALRPRKRDEVAQHLSEMYRYLARKGDVVNRIELDEETFRPRLLDRRGSVIPLHSLSAGEREIYALSLLWALGKTSRRELPVVIDTPLARLDSEHRSNIVKRYLPVAGPQVIVLSTDTEIDREYFAIIEDHLATTLRLEFDPKTECTSVQKGYFQFS